jgi:hypothetical protein
MEDLTLEGLKPMAWKQGPPLPQFLGIFWPWYTAEEPSEEEPEEGAPTTAPNLVLPGAGDNAAGSEIVFEWESVPGATDYRLVIGQGSELSPRFYDDYVSGTSVTLTGFPNDGTEYRWVVLGRNSYGSGPYSEIRSFTNGVEEEPEEPEEPEQPLGLEFGQMTAASVACPSTSAYLCASLSCVIKNPHDVAVTRKVTLMWAQWNQTYQYWICPSSVQDVSGGCSQRYDSVCPVTRCVTNPFTVTLAPGDTMNFTYKGYCQPAGFDWPIGEPALFKHRTNYFYLKDDLGNKSNDGQCES